MLFRSVRVIGATVIAIYQNSNNGVIKSPDYVTIAFETENIGIKPIGIIYDKEEAV